MQTCVLWWFPIVYDRDDGANIPRVRAAAVINFARPIEAKLIVSRNYINCSTAAVLDGKQIKRNLTFYS